MIVIAVVIVVLFSSCAKIPQSQKYVVRKIEHVSGNRYILTTDSFKVVRHTRGAGRYHRDSVSKIGITHD